MTEQVVGRGRAVIAGEAIGPALVLGEPLSLWGGLDPETGLITDHHHPQCGASVAGTVVFMPSGRGSSSASSILVEAVRVGTAPVAFVLEVADDIIALGALVGDELYQRLTPVVVAERGETSWVETGLEVRIDHDTVFRADPAHGPQNKRRVGPVVSVHESGRIAPPGGGSGLRRPRR